MAIYPGWPYNRDALYLTLSGRILLDHHVQFSGLERHRGAKKTDDLLELAARAVFVLRVLNMMVVIGDDNDEGVERVGEFAMEALEAVQYNTHPIDQVQSGREVEEEVL